QRADDVVVAGEALVQCDEGFHQVGPRAACAGGGGCGVEGGQDPFGVGVGGCDGVFDGEGGVGGFVLRVGVGVEVRFASGEQQLGSWFGAVGTVGCNVAADVTVRVWLDAGCGDGAECASHGGGAEFGAAVCVVRGVLGVDASGVQPAGLPGCFAHDPNLRLKFSDRKYTIG